MTRTKSHLHAQEARKARSDFYKNKRMLAEATNKDTITEEESLETEPMSEVNEKDGSLLSTAVNVFRRLSFTLDGTYDDATKLDCDRMGSHIEGTVKLTISCKEE